MQQALRSKSLRLKTLMCFAHFEILTASQKCPCQQAFLLLVADAGKFNNPAGSDEKCSGENSRSYYSLFSRLDKSKKYEYFNIWKKVI